MRRVFYGVILIISAFLISRYAHLLPHFSNTSKDLQQNLKMNSNQVHNKKFYDTDFYDKYILSDNFSKKELIVAAEKLFSKQYVKIIELKNAITPSEFKNYEFLIYSLSYCRYCKMAKQYLKERGAGFSYIDMDDNKNLINNIVDTTGHRTVPQIFLFNKLNKKLYFIGGYTELTNFLY